MKKKLLLLGILAALSTTGFAAEKLQDPVVYAPDGLKAESVDYSKLATNVEAANKNFANIEGQISDLTSNIKDNLNSMNQIQQGIETKVNGVQGQVNELDGKITNLDQANKDQDIAIQGLQGQANFNSGKIHELNEKVDTKVDKVAFDSANAVIQGQIDDVNGKVDGLDNRVDGIVAANKAENDKQNGRLDKVEATNKVQDEAISGVQAQANYNSDKIYELNNGFANHEGRIAGLEKRVDNLDNKMNEGMSLMAAMNAVDFQSIAEGEMALGAGIGHYGNAQSVAVGVAYAPTENLNLNAKYSITAGNADSFAIGAGATYKFKLR